MKMSEMTDAYLQGWTEGFKTGKGATVKVAKALFLSIKCGNEPDSCETPEHCAEVDLMIERLEFIEK